MTPPKASSKTPRVSTDCMILREFYSAGEHFVSGEDLADKIGISRTAIWSHIADFRKIGFVFESQPNVGYRLVETPDLLIGDDLMARCNSRIIGREIAVYRETGSTNDRVAERAVQGADEGLVVFAETQTRGRGRMRRSWESQDRKGLWFSFLIRHAIPPQAASQLTVMTTLGVLQALHQLTHLPLRIKWPNDIYCEGRKVAGILTELDGDLDRIHHCVIGVGINVNQNVKDFSPAVRKLATSLQLCANHSFHRPELAAAILESLDRCYARLKSGSFDEFLEEWKQWDDIIGRQISVRTGHRVIEGQASHLDRDGALVVRLDSGVNERVTSGDLEIQSIRDR